MIKIPEKINSKLEYLAEMSTNWIGSVNSLIIHTIIFVISFVLYFFGVNIDKILLIVTTVVSLEAIYLAIFIQMSVNQQKTQLGGVATDIDEIQEDVEEIEKDIDEIQEDVEEIEKDVDEIQEDIENDTAADVALNQIEKTLIKLMDDIAELRKQRPDDK